MKKLDWSGCLSGTPTPAVPVAGVGLWKAGVLTSLQTRSPGNCGCGGSCGCVGHGGRTGGTGVSEKASDRNEAGSTVSTRGLSGGTSEDEAETSTAAPFWERPSVGVVWEEEATACERFVPPGEGVGQFYSRSNKASRRSYDLDDDMDDAQERAQAEYLEEAWSAYSCGGKISAAGCSIGDPCEVLPPCVDPRTAEDFWSMDMPAETLLFDLKWIHYTHAPRDAWWVVTLLTTATSLIVENLDIVEWVENRLFDDDFFYVSNFIRNLKGRVPLKLCGSQDSCHDTYSSFSGVIFMPHFYEIDGAKNDSTFVAKYLKPWMFPVSTNSNIDRICIAVDLSATLLHEFFHTRRIGVSNYEHSGNCEFSYLFENMFRWAMYKRYPMTAWSRFLPHPGKRDGVNSRPRERWSPVSAGNIDWMWGSDESIFPFTKSFRPANEPVDDIKKYYNFGVVIT
jgi:hypothetical protein